MVIGQFYPFIGGAERQCLKLCKILKKRGHKVKVLTVWRPRVLPREEKIEDIPVERVWYPVVKVRNRKIIGFGFLCFIFMAYKVYRVGKECDIIHVHQGLWPAFSALLGGLWCKKPVVCKIGNSGERFDLLQLRRSHIYGSFAVWLMKKKINKFIWTSKAMYKDLIEMKVSLKRLTYIPNGVELTNVEIREDKKDIVNFIYVGSLTPKKNVLLLIKVLKNLPLTYRNRLFLTIVGEGKEEQRLIELIRKGQLQDYVHLQGAVSDIEQFLSNSEVFILPSITEGLSNAALEAMASGLGLILSYTGGNTDLIETDNEVITQLRKDNFVTGANGIYIDHNRPESLAAAMKYMVDKAEQRRAMGRRSREIACERYSMEKVVLQYEQLYRRCIDFSS